MGNLQPSPAMQRWLNNPGSLIQRIQQQGVRAQVFVLKEHWRYPLHSEQAFLGVKARRFVFIREVEIAAQGQALLFARSIIPAITLTGRERLLAKLGNRSLGSVLFADPQLERSPFKIEPCQLPAYSALPLWQRQSLFHIRKKPLLLTEVFLPPLIDLIERS